MRKLTCFTFLAALTSTLALASGCILPNDTDDDDGQGGSADGGAGPGGSDQGGAGQGGSGTGGNLEGGWNTSSHPCVGNRTDALLHETDGTVFVGCGSTTSGHGLYVSSDHGDTFAMVETDVPGMIDGFRVLDVSRSSDGLVYVAGTGPDGAMVISLDTSVSPMTVGRVLNSQPTIDEQFTVGTFRRNDDGSAMAESLNGHAMLYRPDDSTGPEGLSDGWENAYYWANGGAASFQILDLETHAGQFYGCGSTIADTPKLYIPQGSGEPFFMKVIELSTTFSGEMWGMDVAPDGSVVVGGVDQNRNVGMVYVSVGDPSLEVFNILDVSDLVGDSPSWIRGVCTDGNRIVAVGELSQQSKPLVFTSTDAGQSWEDITPDAPGPVHECQMLDGGAFTVVGSDGFIGTYVP